MYYLSTASIGPCSLRTVDSFLSVDLSFLAIDTSFAVGTAAVAGDTSLTYGSIFSLIGHLF